MRRCVIAVSVLALAGVAVVPRVAPAQSTNPQAIDPAWLTPDSAAKTAQFRLVAGLTGLNGALNFNGFRDGELTLTVPVGWTVVMPFENHDAVLPHSAEIIPESTPVPTGPVPPAFDRAFTVRLEQGIQHGETDDIRFVANKAGSFLVFCAVPGHGTAGMWIRFKVAKAARQPGMALTALTASQVERGWVAFDGREWAQYAPREKQAYVAGFLAGGALADGERSIAADADTAAIHRAVDSLYRGSGLRFPFGHVVYVTQLNDFYWWDNHVPVPLYLALRDINVRLKRQDR